MKKLFCVLAISVATTLGCMGMPVTPSPLTAERAADLRTTLVSGKWRWVGQQKPDGERKPPDFDVEITFRPDGRARWVVMGSFDNEGSWTLDGANIVNEIIWGTLRAESWDGKHLKVFCFVHSRSMYLERI